MKNKLLLLAVVVIVGALLYYCFNTGNKSEAVSAAAGETYKLEYTHLRCRLMVLLNRLF